MSHLRAILDRLGDIENSISDLEKAQAKAPSATLALSLVSLESRREMLREELNEISANEMIDICDYKFIPERSESYALSAVTAALQSFQEMVSFTFNSITKKVQQKAKLSRETIEKTQFDFGFSHSGSLGIVLTMPNERLLLVDSDIEKSVSAVFEIMRSKTADDIKRAANNYGIPAVRKLYKWSKTHNDYGMAVDIKWVREGNVKFEVSVQGADIAEICVLIEQKSDKSTEDFELSGNITAWSVPRRSFTLEFPEGDPISGQWSKDFDGSMSVNVPAHYRAQLTKETVVKYVSDEDEIRWYLNGLKIQTIYDA